MKEKPIKGDKFWRSAALILLCGLVYFFSYDHGRKETERRVESIRSQASADLELQRQEILRLQNLLKECRGGLAEEAPRAGSMERMTLRVNQSRIVFDGQLVLTLLRVEGAENRAVVQLNFLDEERVTAEEVMAGGAIRFELDGRNWALVLSGLSLSSVTLNLMELNTEPNNGDLNE